MISPFFRIQNLGRKYPTLYILLKLMNKGILYFGLSFFLLCDKMWKRKPKAFCYSEFIQIFISARHTGN